MTAQFAAQYIRMSTDKQDLSPSVQKEAIAAYAAASGMEIVASYEDEGRSGVHLKNRPGLLKLLRDSCTVVQSPRGARLPAPARGKARGSHRRP